MDSISLLGFLAGALTTLAFFPQLLQTWRSRSARDVSFAMLLIFCTGVFLWLVYGTLISSWPVIAANAVTLVLAGTILILKIRWG